MWTGRAASDYPEEWPVEWPVPEAGPRVPVTPSAAPAASDRVAQALSQAPERAPAEAPPAACEYPEEWEVDEYLEATLGAEDADRDPSPGAPGRAAGPAGAPPPGPNADFADEPPPVRRDRNPFASASRSVRQKGHYSRRDQRHEGPRLLTWH